MWFYLDVGLWVLFLFSLYISLFSIFYFSTIPMTRKQTMAHMLVPWTLSEKKEFGLSLLCPSSLPSSLLPSTFQPPSPPQYTPVVYSGPDAGLTPVSVVSGSFSLSVCLLSHSQDLGKGGRKPHQDLLCPPSRGALHLCR